MINQEFLDLLREEELAQTPLQIARGLFFGFLITYQDDFPELKNYFLDENEHRPIFPYDQFQRYQISLCKTNPDTLKIELKVPMFGGVEDEEFDRFLDLLLQFNVSGSGHLNLKRDFSIFDASSKIDKEALNNAKSKLGKDFDLEKAAIVVSYYYETSNYATKLAAYLGGTAFLQDYKSYVSRNR